MLSDSPSSSPVTTLAACAIFSLLGESATAHAGTRGAASGKSVLSRTLDRARAVAQVQSLCVLCWDDQRSSVADVNAKIRSLGPRRTIASIEETSAALRWSDGWRGGLLGKTTFDRGFDAEAILAALEDSQANAAILIDPSSAVVDPKTIDSLIDHLASLPDQTYAFAPGAVGSGAMIIRREGLAELFRMKRGPGSLTMYHPDRPAHDPIAKSYAIAVPPRVARSAARLTVDSDRQAHRLSLVQAGDAESMVASLESESSLDAMPRDVTLELTTRRATKPAWSMLSAFKIDRPELSLEAAKVIFAQLGEVDDVRLTLGGVGDPLLHPQVLEIIAAARGAGIRAVHVETDLLPDNVETIDALAGSAVDVLSVHLPAAHVTTYSKLMGVDRMRDVLDHVKRFLLARAARNSGVPIFVPTFVKCEANLGEMEAWYDQWIRAVGTAVISGPSDFSGRIEYLGLADMTGGRRRPCRRLNSRLTILSNGTIASCEEDVLADQPCGTHERIAAAWTDGLAMLRSLHAEHRWDESATCQACRMWDRP